MVRQTMVRRPEAVNAHPPEYVGNFGSRVAWRERHPLTRSL